MQELLTGDKLIDFVKKISSKEEFDFFLQCLVRDYIDNEDEWENTDLLSYLTGLCGYVHDIEGYYQNTGEKVDINVITRRIVAEMLLAASVYE
ncbi:MAG: hypothetical protein AAF298_11030 [Cyanobacteria bacterium P01_A01_bin.40]